MLALPAEKLRLVNGIDMNVYIMVDMEGISRIFTKNQVISEGSGLRYQ